MAKKKAQSKPAAKAAKPSSKGHAKHDQKPPKKLQIRMYQVGFGDCFLLTFKYSKDEKQDKHVLVDFGTTAQTNELMVAIANDIAKVTGGKLHAVVATHRHRDHISGFATAKGKGSGDIIAGLKPDLVVQPWTEDPEAKTDAKVPTKKLSSNQAFVRGLMRMDQFAGTVQQFATQAIALRHEAGGKATPTLVQLGFLGENNLANLSAVKNLQELGGKNEYLSYGSETDLAAILGVKIRVLGPPTLEQTDKTRKQRSKDAAEFWHFQAQAGQDFVVAETSPFPDAGTRNIPPSARWITHRLDRTFLQQMLGVVRILDDAMNNTSLILLLEIGNQKLLFPGDAQIENWSYALFDSPDHEENQQLLADVDLYKVGHHGSLNATPKSLWALFKHRSKKPTKERLKTLMSTQLGVHGHTHAGTEVPRSKLVQALNEESDLHSTDKKKKTKLTFEPPKLVEIEFD
ncbi:MAG: MBL fold metallo-hydrolase [Pirellulaceae bacterium]